MYANNHDNRNNGAKQIHQEMSLVSVMDKIHRLTTKVDDGNYNTSYTCNQPKDWRCDPHPYWYVCERKIRSVYHLAHKKIRALPTKMRHTFIELTKTCKRGAPECRPGYIQRQAKSNYIAKQ